MKWGLCLFCLSREREPLSRSLPGRCVESHHLLLLQAQLPADALAIYCELPASKIDVYKWSGGTIGDGVCFPCTFLCFAKVLFCFVFLTSKKNSI